MLDSTDLRGLDALVCGNCGSRENSVKDSRPVAGTVRRRRYCDFCGNRWTTYEVGEGIGLIIKFDRMLQRIRDDDMPLLRDFFKALVRRGHADNSEG